MTDDFTSHEIRRLLDLLEAELARRGVAATMYVVGGAAIALNYSSGRRTKDVDATFVPEQVVLDAARAVADAEGLPLNWLNADAAPWVPPRAAEVVSAPIHAGLRGGFRRW
ncbi:hypothetical protein [Kribbella sp. NPDC051718]|uniref:hypothetical protein n=1 Tax=Kribbella sp. NPDC051718 TaxID=3155168 RepID=UPI0034336C1F